MLEAGKRVMVLSAGALLPRPDLIALAKDGGQIIVPTGALLGLDAVTAAAEGRIRSVRMVTRKPPARPRRRALSRRQRHLGRRAQEPKLVFAGTAREAAAGFPANVNVAAALSLAGIGPDRTTTEIWADPAREAQLPHDRGRCRLGANSRSRSRTSRRKIRRTGRITALSVLAALRKLNAPLRVGT